MITYTRLSETGRTLCIQVLDIPSGACISRAVDVLDKAPADLRGYQGGWDLYPRIYISVANACAKLERDGWMRQ